MPPKFEFGSTQKLFDRIENDKVLKELINEIILKCKMASDKGVPMDELASACTMGWFMGQDPSIQKIYDYIIAKAKNA